MVLDVFLTLMKIYDLGLFHLLFSYPKLFKLTKAVYHDYVNRIANIISRCVQIKNYLILDVCRNKVYIEMICHSTQNFCRTIAIKSNLIICYKQF